MVCKICKSEWKTERSISKSIVSCPFCGANLNDNNDNGQLKTFFNSREVLMNTTNIRGENVDIIQMIEMLPEEDRKLIFEIVKKFVLAWDPGMTKLKAIEEERDRIAWEMLNKAGEDLEWD
jgi:hypothetical protein